MYENRLNRSVSLALLTLKIKCFLDIAIYIIIKPYCKGLTLFTYFFFLNFDIIVTIYLDVKK